MNPLDAGSVALLVVHLQNEIANPDGAFGGFFAGEALRNRTSTRPRT